MPTGSAAVVAAAAVAAEAERLRLAAGASNEKGRMRASPFDGAALGEGMAAVPGCAVITAATGAWRGAAGLALGGGRDGKAAGGAEGRTVDGADIGRGGGSD